MFYIFISITFKLVRKFNKTNSETPSAKSQEPSAKYRVPSTKSQVPSAKCQGGSYVVVVRQDNEIFTLNFSLFTLEKRYRYHATVALITVKPHFIAPSVCHHYLSLP